ncbi:hypothetical protein EDB83DRAFT_1083593 [Lactarius deliciosus]|nr:hypothetical protein EDB83DRAFT_1083593 [Lactarius deliciosus]
MRLTLSFLPVLDSTSLIFPDARVTFVIRVCYSSSSQSLGVLVVPCVMLASTPRLSFIEPRSTTRAGGATEIHCCNIQCSLSIDCMSAEAVPTLPVLDVGVSDASCVIGSEEVSRMSLGRKVMRGAEGA